MRNRIGSTRDETLDPFTSLEEFQQAREDAQPVIRRTLSRFNLAQPENVEDVLQEAFRIFLQKRSAPSGEPIRDVPAYQSAIARNAAYRFARKEIAQQHLARMVEAVDGDVYLPNEPMPYERRLVKSSLPKLSKRDRQLLRLCYVDDLSVQEIQACLGYRRPNSVSVALLRAMRRLKGIVQESMASHPR